MGKLREQQLFCNERKNDREETKSGRGTLTVEPEGEGSWAVAGEGFRDAREPWSVALYGILSALLPNCGCCCLVAQLCPTLWNPVDSSTPGSMGISRQEYWSGLSLPSLGDLTNPGIEPLSPALQADSWTSCKCALTSNPHYWKRVTLVGETMVTVTVVILPFHLAVGKKRDSALRTPIRQWDMWHIWVPKDALSAHLEQIRFTWFGCLSNTIQEDS